MENRITYQLLQVRKQRQLEKREKALKSNVVSVEAYANGTTGYLIKQGANKGKVRGHLTVKSKNV
jgi:hypothetical protein|tara:strand:- start:185 stop:379 length:195 start_codon:yes stop_codon:yes gene_type:complete